MRWSGFTVSSHIIVWGLINVAMSDVWLNLVLTLPIRVKSSEDVRDINLVRERYGRYE